MATIDPKHQLVILARLSEFCQYHSAVLQEKDPWGYMLRKLGEIEEPLTNLKKELYAATAAKLLAELKAGGMKEERYADFKGLFERLLSPGDFADLAIHLTTQGSDAKTQLAMVTPLLKQFTPITLFAEERKPPEERSASWEKLIKELYERLGLDRLGEVLKRKPRTAKRKRYVLRRIRRDVAEYCSVLHIPTDPADTFTPFMLPRIEALVAANLRFLDKYR